MGDRDSASASGHSAEYFGEQRDYWWNRDFVALLAERCELTRAGRVLDVGSGLGHWTRVLLPFLPQDAEVRGIDAEPAWVEQSNAWAQRAGLSGRVRYQVAGAEALPFADGSFDLVTCQTVLIHVPDPARVLREMLRVLRPGGALLLAEPNNLASALVRDSVAALAPLEEQLTLARFQAVCERGKANLGLGDNSVGDRLPREVAEAGARNLRVWLSDRAPALLPPYATPAEQAEVKQTLDWSGRDFWIWDRPETHRYFTAGGGAASDFPALWSLTQRRARAIREAILDGTYASPGGQITYVIAAEKPD